MPLTTRCKVLFWAALVALSVSATPAMSLETITIGLNLPLSGPRKTTGLSTKEGAELIRNQVNNAGGLLVGNKRYPVNFVYGDNESNPQKAVSVTLDQITKDNVLGIVGPNSSSNAIPAGGICESFKAPMVSPTSTNPRTTQDRPYVFRACFLDNFQGEVMARFAIREFKAEKAAVLYNIASAYPKGLAEYFKDSFEKEKGKGSVVAFEKFLPNETELSAHLKRIVDSGADVLFVPQYAHEIPEIVKQAREAGWNKIILGGDAWEASDLVEKCGDQCKGLFYSSHFAAIGAKGITETFVKQYEAQTAMLPTAYGALGYDSVNLLLTAISQLDGLTDNVLDNRNAIMQRLASIKNYQGVSGSLDMDKTGNPAKSAVVIKINDNGDFESYAVESP
ncbi:ABC transporter substrate-binding protein [Desulfosediminicola flagellatus]|uniref:ABC transporter substrate-binding protein n=1 Tax=Desulfosediminicola flagellatus TaxID=2569541 RepID=UPI0010AD0192|nr:ABC transporter substrate-binding protein [Desulfosediminicola flagellatus]